MQELWQTWELPHLYPQEGPRFMPPMLQLPGRRQMQRSPLCAHNTVPTFMWC